MKHLPAREKTAQLVMSAQEPDKNVEFGHVGDFRQIHDFIAQQSIESHIGFNWHYLDPTLRRKLTLTCARSAIKLHQAHLYVADFVVNSHELYGPNYDIDMEAFALNASGIFEPHTEHDDYIQAGMQHPELLYAHYVKRRSECTRGEELGIVR